MVTGRKESNFLINTYPEFTSDIMLNNKDRLQMLIDRSMAPEVNEFEIGSKIIYSRSRGMNGI